MPVTEPSPTKPPIKKEGLTWQQVQTEYGARYKLPSTPPEAVGNRYTTVESGQGLRFYYRKPLPPMQYGRDYDVQTLAVMAREKMLQPTFVPRPPMYGVDYEVRDLALLARNIPQEKPSSQGPPNWEEPWKIGPAAGLMISTAPGGYRPAKKEPSMFEQFSNLISKGNIFQRSAQFDVKQSDPEYWFGNPITGKYGINPQGKAQGVTYAWSAYDVYNIVTTGLLIYSAAVALRNVPRLLAAERSLASREAIRSELYGKADEVDDWIRWRDDFGQADREFWQQTQQPLQTDPRLTRWHVETNPQGWAVERPGESFLRGSGQPTGGLAATQRVIPEEFERVIWEAPFDLTRISVSPRVMPYLPSALPYMFPALIGLPRMKKPSQIDVELPSSAIQTQFGDIQIPRSKPSTIQIPFIDEGVSAIVEPFTGFAPMQKEKAEQIQPVIPKQLQRTSQWFEPQTALTRQTPRYPFDEFSRRRYQQKGKDMFGFSGRTRNFYPIMTAKRIMKAFV